MDHELVADYSRIRQDRGRVPGLLEYQHARRRARRLPAFSARVAARWKTKSGKAEFLLVSGLEEDPRCEQPGALILATVRSHDQYNTTIYGLDDRYRGISGRATSFS